MTKEELVYDVLAKVSKKEKAAIKPEHDLVADLGLDSPKQLQLLTELEETLKIEISDEEAGRIVKVGDILAHVAQRP